MRQAYTATRATNTRPGYTLFSPLFASDVATQQANVPDITVFRSDNRSRYDGMSIHLQGNLHRFTLIVNYTLSRAETWGCVLGELFDYVDGVCNPLHAFGPGDYRPVRRRRHAPLRAGRNVRICRAASTLRRSEPG